MTNLIQRFEANTAGRDFVVGDIHGHFAALAEALSQLDFNPHTDRLFSVGDLVDRGPDSAEALTWLAKPWFHAVRGNHEEMAIGFYRDRIPTDKYLANGGAWFVALTKAEQQPFADTFDTLPYAIEIQTQKGLVGVVHAECPFVSWADLEPALSSEHSASFKTMITWSRDRYELKETRDVQGIYAVFVGHTPVKEPVSLGNVFYIDTGAYLAGGALTVVDLATLEP